MATRYRIVLDNDDDDEVGDLLADKRTLLGLSDAGAHASQLCDACYSTHLLGHWVRERKALRWRTRCGASPATRTRRSASPTAGWCRRASTPTSSPSTPTRSARTPVERVHDQPGGADRLVVRSTGVEHVWVNGVAVRSRRRRRPVRLARAASSAADLRRSPMTITGASADQRLPYLDGRPKQLLIGGQWVDAASGQTFTTANPSTGAPIAELAAGDATDADRAVAAARAAFEGPWQALTPAQRQGVVWAVADAVEANFEELKFLESVDMGMPIGKAPAAGAEHAVSVLRYFAGWATKISGETLPNSMPWEILTYTLREPIGVVAAIIPWNSPVNNVLWKLAPVLATGCTMVLKPAEEASLVALRIGELLTEAGVPDGVVNIVTGIGETVGAALDRAPRRRQGGLHRLDRDRPGDRAARRPAT